jgi:carboxypeptidase Taq
LAYFTFHPKKYSLTITTSTADLYQQYQNSMRLVADISYSAAMLQWDQETYLPPGGADARNRQIATLTELAHEKFTSETLGALLQELNDRIDLTGSQKINITLSLEDYTKKKKLPGAFVRKMAEASGKAFHKWIEARKTNNFKLFAPSLEEIVTLKQEHASLLGFEADPYDALLNEYDKGSTVKQLDVLFDTLKTGLKELLQRIQQHPVPDNSFLHRHYPRETQWNFGLELLAGMGFNFKNGRQDVSAHPFTVSFGSTDVRITIRTDENDFGNMTWSCLHEGGHALYEQGLPEAEYGLPLGEAASFSVHESQSRIWENNVGRSLDYWMFRYPKLQQTFPKQLNDIPLETFYRGMNRVTPSLIRTEADELTYHFHIIIRYEIEKMLLHKEIGATDVPAVWNRKYFDYLGVTPDSDSNGCLQDVHWSHGDMGYFPSYSIGTIMAAQLYSAFSAKNVSFTGEIRNGDSGKLLVWLRNAIHTFGRRFTTGELCKNATSEHLDARFLINYLTDKYNYIYNL